MSMSFSLQSRRCRGCFKGSKGNEDFVGDIVRINGENLITRITRSNKKNKAKKVVYQSRLLNLHLQTKATPVISSLPENYQGEVGNRPPPLAAGLASSNASESQKL